MRPLRSASATTRPRPPASPVNSAGGSMQLHDVSRLSSLADSDGTGLPGEAVPIHETPCGRTPIAFVGALYETCLTPALRVALVLVLVPAGMANADWHKWRWARPATAALRWSFR